MLAFQYLTPLPAIRTFRSVSHTMTSKKREGRVSGPQQIWPRGTFSGYTPLMDAIDRRDLRAAKRLLEQGLNAEELNMYGERALHVVCGMEFKYWETTRGEETDGDGGFTAIDFMELLLAHGVDVHARITTSGLTPLMLAAYSPIYAEQLLLRLLNAGADPHVRSSSGTAYEIALNRSLAFPHSISDETLSRLFTSS